MALRLKAEHVNGTLKPLEPLELQEGSVVTIHIEEQSDNGGRQHNAMEVADRVRRSGPEDAFDNLPADGAQNYRHHLYGHPKEDRGETQ